MVRAGDIIENPITGETMGFLLTSRETAGELLRIDMTVRPGGFVAGEHVHPHQEERFQIASGRITLRVDGQERVYTAGDLVTVPAGTPHVWWNSGNDGLPTNVLQLAVTFAEYRDVLYATSPPWAVQQVLFAVLDPLGRALGYRADEPYSAIQVDVRPTQVGFSHSMTRNQGTRA